MLLTCAPESLKQFHFHFQCTEVLVYREYLPQVGFRRIHGEGKRREEREPDRVRSFKKMVDIEVFIILASLYFGMFHLL